MLDGIAELMPLCHEGKLTLLRVRNPAFEDIRHCTWWKLKEHIQLHMAKLSPHIHPPHELTIKMDTSNKLNIYLWKIVNHIFPFKSML